MELDHIDIVLTHKCPNRCKFCIDKFVNTNDDIVSEESVKWFLDKIKKHNVKTNEVLFLGGEPTIVDFDKLKRIADIVKSCGYSPIVSTNNFNNEVVRQITDIFDWVQITVHNDKQIEYFKNIENHNKINIKMAGDHTMNIEKLEHFIDVTRDFERRSISMYFTPDFKELCTDEDVWLLLNGLKWERCGSYLYTFYKGVRIKRCIYGETNIIDEPLVPKLYPNGNYNKTWCDEKMDDYL